MVSRLEKKFLIKEKSGCICDGFSYTVIKNENHSQLNKTEFSHEKDWFVCSTITFQFIVISDRVKDIALSQLFQLDAQQQFVLFTTRVPRTLSLIIAGSTMSISGLIMQQLTKINLSLLVSLEQPIVQGWVF